MRKRFGFGTPRGLQGLATAAAAVGDASVCGLAAIFGQITRFLGLLDPQVGFLRPSGGLLHNNTKITPASPLLQPASRQTTSSTALLDVDVVPGDVLAIIGPNGSGKTTLMLTLMGVLEPLGGEVSIAGLPPSEYRRRNGFGYLAEDTQMPDGWRRDGILALAATAAGSGSDVVNALRLAGVDYATNLRVGTLSKGVRRRLALAVALMGSARLLMLDEPESGLDPRHDTICGGASERFAPA